jgi:hypothetical protein
MTSLPGKGVRLGFIDFVESAPATNDIEPPPARGCSPRYHPRTELMLGRNGSVSVSISLDYGRRQRITRAEPVFLKTSETRGPVMQGRLSDAAAAPRQTGSQGHCRSIWHGAIGRNHRQGEIRLSIYRPCCGSAPARADTSGRSGNGVTSDAGSVYRLLPPIKHLSQGT